MQRPQRSYLIAGSLFAVLFLVFGAGFLTTGVFFSPLTKQFGWNRAKVSLLASAVSVCMGIAAPVVGWLIDRFEARRVMMTGAAVAGCALITASFVASFTPLLICYLFLGLGISAAGLIPCSFIVANWFRERRAAVMGIVTTGTTVGGMVMTMVANRAVGLGGWRMGYRALAIPMLVVVLPLIFLMVKSRPTEGDRSNNANLEDSLPGLNVHEALGNRAFWSAALANLCFAFIASSVVFELIIYLIGLGYKPEAAALAMSLVFGFNALGKIPWGLLADRLTARVALSINFALWGFSIILVLGGHHLGFLVAFVPIFGLGLGAPVALMPVLVADSVGLKRFGSIWGLINLISTAGLTMGPIVSGHIFDVTGSYSIAFELCTVMSLVASLSCLACLPLRSPEPALA